jgi:hypothetical protein
MRSDKLCLHKPCRKCPFRTDIAPFLYRERAQEIAESLRRGETFTCHATIDYEAMRETDDGETVSTPASHEQGLFCAGALIALEKGNDGIFTALQARFYALAGIFDKDRDLDMESPVFEGLDAWIAAQEPRLGKPQRRPEKKA